MRLRLSPLVHSCRRPRGPGHALLAFQAELRQGACRTIPLEGGEPRQLTADEPGRSHCCPHIRPGGAEIAYLSVIERAREYPRGDETGALRLIAVDGSGERRAPVEVTRRIGASRILKKSEESAHSHREPHSAALRSNEPLQGQVSGSPKHLLAGQPPAQALQIAPLPLSGSESRLSTEDEATNPLVGLAGRPDFNTRATVNWGQSGS